MFSSYIIVQKHGVSLSFLLLPFFHVALLPSLYNFILLIALLIETFISIGIGRVCRRGSKRMLKCQNFSKAEVLGNRASSLVAVPRRGSDLVTDEFSRVSSDIDCYPCLSWAPGPKLIRQIKVVLWASSLVIDLVRPSALSLVPNAKMTAHQRLAGCDGGWCWSWTKRVKMMGKVLNHETCPDTYKNLRILYLASPAGLRRKMNPRRPPKIHTKDFL